MTSATLWRRVRRPTHAAGRPRVPASRLEIAERDHVDEGLVCVIATVEPCPSLRIAYGEGRPRIVPARRKCLFVSDYLIGPVLGSAQPLPIRRGVAGVEPSRPRRLPRRPSWRACELGIPQARRTPTAPSLPVFEGARARPRRPRLTDPEAPPRARLPCPGGDLPIRALTKCLARCGEVPEEGSSPSGVPHSEASTGAVRRRFEGVTSARAAGNGVTTGRTRPHALPFRMPHIGANRPRPAISSGSPGSATRSVHGGASAT